ncbi:Card1-like endonuclease domain-containing protein [Marinimicrobium sp. ARAG 43.8]|uniref:Card1-like endonuclease domain-containing protein n=1 Tax=Marinimicrobium sp. ARAG 43.8 TaxID=3418719 RepID=UPI003CE6BE78
MTNLHLCIITGQPLANLIPLLQERPDEMVLMHTDDKKEDASAFARTLEKAGFSQAHIHIRPGLPAHPFDDIRMYVLERLEELQNQFPDSRLTWNATGGTKQMALAIWDVLDSKKDRVIYSDTRVGYMEELTPEVGSIALESQLTPELYLHALGKIKRRAESDQDAWCERAQSRKEATRHLGNHAEALAGLVQQFNRKLDSDGGERQSLALNNIGSQWRQALQRLEEHGVLSGQGDGRYNLVNADAARYLTGGWLEEYVWHAAKDQQVDHVQAGLKFGDLAHRKQGQDNEVDAFIVHCNRLLLIECKSGWMGKDARKDSSIIYQLDSIGQHAGGSQATRVLVSAQPLEHETKEGRKVNTKARASATDIHTVEGQELKGLGAAIREWKENGQWSAKG